MWFIADLIDYWFHPKYVIMRGVQMDDRAIMFIGANPVITTSDCGNKMVAFSNHDNQYYMSAMYKRIWTFKELLKVRRLVGKGFKCLRIKGATLERV